MGYYFRWIGSREKARALWENKESLGKYLDRLRDLMMADPDARMTEDETTLAARVRVELFNAGFRGKDLIEAISKRLAVESKQD